MGITTHQPWSRFSATFCIQPVYTQPLSLVYINRATVGTGYSHSSCLFQSHCQHYCSPLYSKCGHSDCPFCLSSTSIIFQAHLRGSYLRLCSCAGCQVVNKSHVKLQHSRTHGTTQSQLNRLVWGSLTLTPIIWVTCLRFSLWQSTSEVSWVEDDCAGV